MEEKTCAYCRKPIVPGEAVTGTLLYIGGSQLARQERDYCSEQCKSYDQMAHEG